MSLTISKIKASAAGCDRARTTELSCVAGPGGSVAGWGKGDPCPVCGGDEVLASWARECWNRGQMRWGLRGLGWRECTMRECMQRHWCRGGRLL